MKRPTSVTVFGILNIVFAAFGLFGLLASVFLFFPQAAASKNPVVQLIHDHAAYAAWLKFSLALGLVAVVAKLAAGIGLLQLKPWGRRLSIIYAIYAMVMVVVGGVVNYFLLVRPLLEQAAQKQGTEHAAAVGGAIGGSFGSCFGLIYPILLLVFMLRPEVAAAFEPASAEPSTPETTN
jgi:D-alanyl-lipoteichoic acid acyltransferase DltB (MBOAT superfamily)